MQKADPTSKKRKRFNKKVFYSITGTLTVLFVVLATFYINYMNYWPFNNDKISGLPDGHIRAVNQEHNSLSLLSHQYGSYEVNFKGSEIGFRLAQYHNGEMVEDTKLGTLTIEGDTDLNGKIDYAITSNSESDEEISLRFDEIHTQINLSGMGIKSSESLGTSINFEDSLASAYYVSEEPVELISGNSIPLIAWSSGGIMVLEINDDFPKNESENRETYIALYLDTK